MIRAVLLRPLRKSLGISIVEEDGDWSRIAHTITKDDWTEEASHRDLVTGFTVVDSFSNQTCRLDSLDSLSRKLSWAIEAVCENGSSFEPFIYKRDLFTKTDSGQT